MVHGTLHSTLHVFHLVPTETLMPVALICCFQSSCCCCMPQRETERSTGDLERLYSLTGDLLTGDLLLMAPLPLLSSNGSALSRMFIPVSESHHTFFCFLDGRSTQTATQVRCNGGTHLWHQQVGHKGMHNPGGRR